MGGLCLFGTRPNCVQWPRATLAPLFMSTSRPAEPPFVEKPVATAFPTPLRGGKIIFLRTQTNNKTHTTHQQFVLSPSRRVSA